MKFQNKEKKGIEDNEDSKESEANINQNSPEKAIIVSKKEKWKNLVSQKKIFKKKTNYQKDDKAYKNISKNNLNPELSNKKIEVPEYETEL